jgi:hypothetical protein
LYLVAATTMEADPSKTLTETTDTAINQGKLLQAGSAKRIDLVSYSATD